VTDRTGGGSTYSPVSMADITYVMFLVKTCRCKVRRQENEKYENMMFVYEGAESTEKCR